MKITADMQPQIQGKSAGLQNISVPSGRKTVQQRPQIINNIQARNILQNTPSEQNLSNALVIMNKARIIIQQALSVSSQLRSEATVTLTSGNVNSTEVRTQMATINSSLTEFNVAVTVPNITEYIPPETTDAINENVQLLRNNSGNSRSDREIIQAETAFKTLDGQLEKQITETAGRLQKYADNYSAQKPDVTALSSEIKSDFRNALNSQGNILPASMETLLA
ncbi:MAG: hypothetical protein JW982_01340 [Spirochaetes bacterium]|nr:hypothetical protein [Spirochaetota bacterium]